MHTCEYMLYIYAYLCIYMYVYVYIPAYIYVIRTNIQVQYKASCRIAPGASIFWYQHIQVYTIFLYMYTHTHNVYTSVDLPMPPGPHSTHLLVVASPLSNQSRMPFSSLDRRWNPFGSLTLNTRIATTLSLPARAVGARGVLITRG